MHHYRIQTTWVGNTGSGTSAYQSYRRDHEIAAPGKQMAIPGSSCAQFRGDAARYNPEELLVSALSACHMLWLLHLCADAGIVVTAYDDDATGELAMNADGSGEFTEVVLHPHVTMRDGARAGELDALHHRAHELCFVARSVRFPVKVEPRISVAF